MNTSKKLRLGASAAGVMVGALALLSTGNARADTSYFESEVQGTSWVMGNSSFNVQATAFGQAFAEGSTSAEGRLYETTSQDMHAVFGKVFGKQKQLISTVASGNATTRSGKYASIQGQVNVLGERIWTAEPEDDSACPSSALADMACGRYDKDWSTPFFQAQHTLMVSFVPVTVKASIKGGVRAHVGARTIAMHGAPANKKHHLGMVTLDAGTGAYAAASMTALAGIEEVLAVGVTATFKLIDIGATSTSSVIHRNDTIVKAFSTSHNLGFDITSMNGKVEVWAHISPFVKPTETLINIAGWTKHVPIAESSSSTVLPPLDP